MLDQTQIPSLVDVDRERHHRSLSRFIRSAWKIIEPAEPYLHNWHIDLIAEHLARIPKDNTRLAINIPPRYMKSIAVTVMWPCWLWTHMPWLRFIFLSYSATLSVKHAVDRRTIIRSDWYQRLWGHKVKICEDQDTKQEQKNTAAGGMVATSVGGSVTGMGGDIIIMDDPMNPAKAISDVERERDNRWIDTTMMTRLNNKKTGSIVLVMQRLHTDDATAHMVEKGGWEHLVIPSPATEDKTITFPNTGRTIDVKKGDPLWPEREDEEQLKRQRLVMGSWAFAGQYEQRPSPLGGGIVKRDWFRLYDRNALDLDDMPRIINSWDLSFKGNEGSSQVCGQAWGAKGPDRFLLDCECRVMGLIDSMRAIDSLHKRWPRTQGVVIEDKANGPAVLEVMRTTIPGMIPFNPQGSKEERLQAVSPQVESGNIYLPSDAEWLEEFLEQVCNFPATKRSDQVDSMTQALLYLGDGRLQFDFKDSQFSQPRGAQGLTW